MHAEKLSDYVQTKENVWEFLKPGSHQLRNGNFNGNRIGGGELKPGHSLGLDLWRWPNRSQPLRTRMKPGVN